MGPHRETVIRQFILLQGLRPIGRAPVPREAIAGITLAALAIPEAMGYTSIAGMPVVTGLYTLLLPTVAFAIFGSSRHLVVGADSATAAMMAASLVTLASPESPRYVALASLAAVMVAGWLILARAIGVAFLADFLSRSVLVGFLTGVGIQVAAGQLAGMLGVRGSSGGAIGAALNVLSRTSEVNLPTAIVSAAVLIVVVGLRLIAKQIPGPLLAVGGSIVASYTLNLAAVNVAQLGPVPGGLPAIGWPDVDWSDIPPLSGATVTMFAVIVAQSAAVSRAYAARYDEQSDENTDLVGLALANVSAGLCGTFVVNGSPTKTEIVDQAGGRSQLAPVSCAVVVLCVLLFLTGPLAFMPKAVLATIVLLIGVELIDVTGLRRVFVARRREFWVAVLTGVVVVAAGVEPAIVVAMAASLISHTRRGYSPHNSVLVRTNEGYWRSMPVTEADEAKPGLVIYRFSHSLYYANAQKFRDETLELAKESAPQLRWLCVDCVAIDDVDFTAGEMLAEVARILKEQHVRLIFAEASDHVRRELDRSGVSEIVGNRAYFADINQVAQALHD